MRRRVRGRRREEKKGRKSRSIMKVNCRLNKRNIIKIVNKQKDRIKKGKE